MLEIFRKIRLILTRSEINQLFLLSFGSLILSIAEAFGIGIIIPIMSLYLNPGRIETSSMLRRIFQLSGAKDSMSFLSILIIAAILLFIFKTIFSIFIFYQQQHFVGRVSNRLSGEVLHSYLNKPLSFHYENNSSALFKNVSAEVGQFTSGFLAPSILICSESLIILGIFLLLVLTYPAVTLSLVVIFAFIMAVMGFFFKSKIKSYASVRQKYNELMYKNALEALQAIKEIKFHNAIGFFVDRYLQTFMRYIDGVVKFNLVSGLLRYILETMLFVCALMILLFSIHNRQAFVQLIPMMTVIAIASLRFLPSLNKINTNINLFHFSKNSLDIIYEILREEKATKVSDLKIRVDSNLPDKDKFIILEHIAFSYSRASKPIFQDLSLEIPLNRVVAFVGETGVGKSTLIDILTGLSVPSRGIFYYRGLAITEQNVLEYQKKVGYVPQHIFLIDDTLQANIAFGLPPDKINFKDLQRAVFLSYLSPLVNSLPEGLKTRIGERGVRLSGGQRQKIGIARALYRNPEVLIMDEATSSLDGHSEAEFSMTIRQLSNKMTVVIVAHRLSTIEHADIIFIIDSGKIADKGSYKELLEDSIPFKKIINHTVVLENK